jgi:hypothetical protein
MRIAPPPSSIASAIASRSPSHECLSSSRTRTGEERLLGLLQGRYGLLPADRREVLKELGRGLPAADAARMMVESALGA